MSDTSNELLKLIHETKAVSIWNRKTGPVFWYAASVPGPFYVNTELVIGPALAEKLLAEITDIIATISEAPARAAKLDKTIMTAYERHPQYKQVIAALVAKAGKEFPEGSYDLVSGGERRDWLFSIPFAKEMSIKHAYLFKNHEIWCELPLKTGDRALHVADLINNAASYFDLWFPILTKANLKSVGTICVNTRGTNGVRKLEEHGQKVVTLNGVDVSFFEKSVASGLIDQGTLEEIETYFSSPQIWAEQYLMKDIALFDVAKLDKKSFERLQSFFSNDPWSLKSKHADFFAKMQGEIAKRVKG